MNTKESEQKADEFAASREYLERLQLWMARDRSHYPPEPVTPIMAGELLEISIAIVLIIVWSVPWPFAGL